MVDALTDARCLYLGFKALAYRRACLTHAPRKLDIEPSLTLAIKAAPNKITNTDTQTQSRQFRIATPPLFFSYKCGGMR